MSEYRPVLIDTFRNRAELMKAVIDATEFPQTGWADRDLASSEKYSYIASNVYDKVWEAGFKPSLELDAWLLNIQTRIGNSAVFSFGGSPSIGPRTLDMADDEYALARRLTNARYARFNSRVGAGQDGTSLREIDDRIASIRADIKEMSDGKRSR